MRKTALVVVAMIAASMTLVGCSATPSDPADTYESFSQKFTSAFNKSVELSNSGEFFYTSEVSSQLARNTIYKDGSSVSIFDGASAAPSCPIQFDLLNSYKKDTKPVPLQAFTEKGTSEEILKSMKTFSETATETSWIVKPDSLYMVTNANSNINIVGIVLNDNGSIDYYMGVTSNDDFNTTVTNIVNDTNAKWNAPNVLVMYAYGDNKDIAISSNLKIDFQWWLDNYSLIASNDINKMAEFDADGNLVLTPVMTSDKAVLLVKTTEDGKYLFFNTDKTEYQVNGVQVVCQAGA